MTSSSTTAASLNQRMRREFSAADWNKGSVYAQRSVRLISYTAHFLRAQVQGSVRQPYSVAIDFTQAKAGVVQALCTCPRFEDAGICKHLAAVIQAADKAGWSDKIPGNGPIELLDPLYEENSDEFFDYDEEPDEDVPGSHLSPDNGVRIWKPTKQRASSKADWKSQLSWIASSSPQAMARTSQDSLRKQRRMLYVVDVQRSQSAGSPVIAFYYQEQLKDSNWGKTKPPKVMAGELQSMMGEEDRQLLQRLFGNELLDDYYGVRRMEYTRISRCALASALAEDLLARLCATGRCCIQLNAESIEVPFTPATWDDGPAWQFSLDWKHDDQARAWVATGHFCRTNTDNQLEVLALRDTLLLFAFGCLIRRDGFARLKPVPVSMLSWITVLQRDDEIRVPDKQCDKFAEEFYRSSPPTEIELPKEFRWRRVQGEPVPHVEIRPVKNSYRNLNELLGVKVRFLYGDQVVEPNSNAVTLPIAVEKSVIERDPVTERRRIDELRRQGCTNPDYYLRGNFDFQLQRKKLSAAVDQLMQLGWTVEAEGHLIRRPGNIQISVTSGVDWFDLNVACDFDGVKAALPELLSALQKGERMITLGDGTRGMLPEEWLQKYASIAELGRAEGDSLRFWPSQAMILDALLAAQPEAEIDKNFQRVRDKLRSFGGVKPAREPASFRGELREYQREGLGWLMFLNDFRFGGCLADDMGLGKTIQVLALLETHRKSRATRKPMKPSLVVVPKSLVFNWIDEAARFVPNLRVVNHTGKERRPVTETAREADLIVTTYATLRLDILKFSKIPFHYVILDEAQAIKNPQSQSAKACRLLSAQHRLAMTGTPVENQLGDLWSLFEFLNPGMLGRSNQLSLFAGRSRVDNGSVDLLAKALRPFMLRRTKEQVLTELPEKTEQTLYCELDPKQRKLYEELRKYYQALLTKKIETVGLGKAKIHVLEALLRLRQVACHPALVDKSKAKVPSAKLETLLEQLHEVIDENHKVLVFSQFTSLLALVRQKLDREGVVYEYLDGKTRDRKSRVEHFQTNKECRVFLISLKAGGHGLNLTAADYVFILDPWWNPAVEMQAVDRVHRIGQTKPVFAYRLIARDTVEEKILELQKQKKSLAEAIISADENLLRTLTAEDLQMLLS